MAHKKKESMKEDKKMKHHIKMEKAEMKKEAMHKKAAHKGK
jgi:hypothetical protein